MKTFLLSVALILGQLAFCTEAQLTIKVVDAANNKLKHATLKVYEGNSLKEVDTLRSNKAKLGLPGGHYYTIEIGLENHASKWIVLDMRTLTGDFETYEYTFYVELDHVGLFAEIESVDEFLDYPIAIIEPDEDRHKLTYNTAYMKSSRKHRMEVFLLGQDSNSSIVLND